MRDDEVRAHIRLVDPRLAVEDLHAEHTGDLALHTLSLGHNAAQRLLRRLYGVTLDNDGGTADLRLRKNVRFDAGDKGLQRAQLGLLVVGMRRGTEAVT